LYFKLHVILDAVIMLHD